MKGSQNQRSILSFFGTSANQKSKKSPVKEVLSNGSSQNNSESESPIRKKGRCVDEKSIKSETSETRDAIPSTHVKKRKRSSSPEPNTSGEKSNGIPNGDSDIGFSADTVPPLRKTARKQMVRQNDSVESHQVEVVKNIKNSPQNKGKKSNTVRGSSIQGDKPKRSNCLDNFIFKKASHRNEMKDKAVNPHSSNDEIATAKEDAASVNNNISESVATAKEDAVSVNNNISESVVTAKEDAASVNNNISESVATAKTCCNTEENVADGCTDVDMDEEHDMGMTVKVAESMESESDSSEAGKESKLEGTKSENNEAQKSQTPKSKNKSKNKSSPKSSQKSSQKSSSKSLQKSSQKSSPKSRTPNVKTDKSSPKPETSKTKSDKSSRRSQTPKSKSVDGSPLSETSNKSSEADSPVKSSESPIKSSKLEATVESSESETPNKSSKLESSDKSPKTEKSPDSSKSGTPNKSSKSESSPKSSSSEPPAKSPKSETPDKSSNSESPVRSSKSKSSPKSLKSESSAKSSKSETPAKSLNSESSPKSSKSETPAKSPNSESSPKSSKSETPAKSPNSESSPKSSKSESSAKSSKPEISTPKAVPKNPFLLGSSKSEKESYNPSKSHYHPIDDATWKKGEDVPFCVFSKTLELIEDTSGRLKTIEILSNFLRSVILLSPADLLYCIYLCLNKVAPSFESIELGVGEIYVCRVIAQATGRSVNMIKSDLAEKGDLGIVAEHSKSNQRMMFQPARLTVKKVFLTVKEVALMSGQASQTKKMDKMKSMFVSCKGSEARFLIRFFCGKLRIGLAEQSVLQAIAQACYLTPPGQEYPPAIVNAGKGLSPENLKGKIEEYSHILKTTYCECPTFDVIVPVLLEHGLKELPNHCKLEPGIPLKPMLAHPTKGVAEVLKRFSKCKFTCEFKYDGERAQLHLKEDGSISIFSRNQENNTTKYPDIIGRLKDFLGPDVKSCIIDAEAVAYDVENKKILPFQILSTRKRKDVNEGDIKVQVCVFPFDLLYLNGRNLVTEPLEVRRNFLRENFKEVEGQFCFAKSMDSTNTEDIEEFLEESIKGSCEGLMVKSLDVDATYEIAKRSHNWLKLKKDYLEGVGDTIDVVVIGGYLGKGKRTGTYGGFLLACYDPDNEEFQSLCKLGTGLTEDVLQKHTEYLKEHVIESPKSYYRVEPSISPDHWFDAVQVWEIKCADLSVSPVHKAAIGIVDPEKGISLRFPRFLRIRDDKSPENATSSHQIAELYRNQDR